VHDLAREVQEVGGRAEAAAAELAGDVAQLVSEQQVSGVDVPGVDPSLCDERC